ncbi:Hypp3518 [Branchiostoma lanceolatum]|uniref:Hypp3518 protein n=1 Tax=Branchiostoma lanceolatum TaxID=7740 RepID=A0A8K0A355_BRALA|nr:Hypp3518 [Branchiostoma lanceolatum]
MDEETNGPSLGEIKRWTVPALRDFLRVRGLKTTGLKDDLISLVNAAVLLRYPIKPDEIAEDRRRSAEYAELLIVKGTSTKLPDPLSLTEGWIKETDGGVKQWPPVSYFEVAAWILSEAPCVSLPRGSSKDQERDTLHKRLLSDYKEGKAYSYFDSKWLNEVLYHPIAPDSDMCLVKTTCTPSQSIRNIPHTVWVALEKKSGSIVSAYCSCFAGLGSTCNHVAAVIFNLDHAFMMGESTPCTSKECTWNVYSGGAAAVLKAKPIIEMEWVKPNYHKGANRTPINSVKKKLFNPLENSTNKPTSSGLFDAMFPSCQNSTVFKYMHHDTPPPPAFPPQADFNLDTEMETETTVDCTPLQSLSEMASGKQTVQSFIDSLPAYTINQVATIEVETRGQADNTQWANFRSGMITASNLKSVVTRNDTLHNEHTSLSKDPQPLIKTLMGYTPLDPDLPSLKYGRLLEPLAREAYKGIQKEKGHQNMEVTECGLFVHPKKAFLGASPDGLVQCTCCGEGLLEVKCPRTSAMEKPRENNTDFLQLSERGDTELKHKHSYFYQVQAQMGVTGRRWCDFFVYSKAGYHLERIYFNEDFRMGAAVAAEQFFKEYIAPELVHRKIDNEE